MGKLPIRLLSSIFFISLLLHTLPTGSLAADDGKEFDYQENGEKGPDRWGELYPEWRACSNGTMQSPIDLQNENVEEVSHLGLLNRNYKPSNANLKNSGHDIKVEWKNGAGTIKINGIEYVLKESHWHSPSEHTIDGEKFSLELHMVHESQDGKVAVVGVLYTIGEPDSFLSSLTKYIRLVAGTKEAETVVGIVNPNDIKTGIKYYRYMGSLTTPPCDENVTWTVIKKVRTVTEEQVNLLRAAVPNEYGSNARPIQSTNGRLVQLYEPDEDDDDKDDDKDDDDKEDDNKDD